jgi:tetratricopeptide (TPR) repeat protein
MIKPDASNVDINNYDAIIRFYENNLLYFDNFQLISDEDSLIEIINIKSHYINALIKNNRHTKALKALENRDLLLDRIRQYNDLYRKQSEIYKFYVGSANGYLKNYKVAINIFEELCECDPDNDMYRDWLEQMKFKQMSKHIPYVGYGGVFVLFIAGYCYKFSYSNILLFIGIIMVLIAALFPYSNKILRKLKQKNKPTP